MRARWLVGPVHDTVLATLFVPFVVAARWVGPDTETLVAATLALSFAHQPLTVGLVYGDPAERDRHRRLYRWSPAVLVVAVVAGLAVSPVGVALVAGGWNAAHTLRQRYGIVRLYGRLAGHDDGRAENVMLWWWLVAAVAVAVTTTDIDAAIARTGLGGRNATAVDGLDAVASGLPAVAAASVLVAAWATVRWLQLEARRPVGNPAKWLYLAATAALLVILAVDPIAGFVGYVGAHAVEYLLVVRRRLATPGGTGDGWLGAVVATAGPTTAVVGAAAVVAAIPTLARAVGPPPLADVVVLTLGGLHLLHDAFVWRARPVPTGRPEVLVA